ncbi:MAG: hypothetical protein M1829_004867 [Trizodia sp. TS-e1964]|nr:MAG: hypothetical protein M1829_004867 [Trizodia sp. TS-e1964]
MDQDLLNTYCTTVAVAGTRAQAVGSGSGWSGDELDGMFVRGDRRKKVRRKNSGPSLMEAYSPKEKRLMERWNAHSYSALAAAENVKASEGRLSGLLETSLVERLPLKGRGVTGEVILIEDEPHKSASKFPTSATSKILASFQPKTQPKTSTPTNSLSQSPSSAAIHGAQNTVPYVISDDSGDDTKKPSVSQRSTNMKGHEDHDKAEEEELPHPMSPPRLTSSYGRPLKTRSDLTMTLTRRKYRTSGPRGSASGLASRLVKSRFPSNAAADHNQLQLGSSLPNEVSSRVALRAAIANETIVRRDTFFCVKKEFFLPLLPGDNYVQKLLEKTGSQPGGSEGLAIQPYKALVDQPAGVRATMKPYQLGGLSFLVYLHHNGLSGILGDEMGLGKTLQTLSLFQYLKENQDVRRTTTERQPFLVICPLSVLSSWVAEAKKWTPELKVLRFHGSKNERDRLKRVAQGDEDIQGNVNPNTVKRSRGRIASNLTDLDNNDQFDYQPYDLVVTTYENFEVDNGWFKRVFVWRYVVLDEGHKIKNERSLISKSLQSIGAEHRLILTGTPLQNDLTELWALFHWLYPDVFVDKTVDLFNKSFNLSKGLFSNTVVDDSRRLLEIIMLRRMKDSPGVNLNLPPKTEVLLFIPLSPLQRFWYQRLITRSDKGILDELFKGAKDKEVEARRVEAGEEQAWQKKDIAQLEETDVHANDGWEESKVVLQETLQREKSDPKSSADYKKLMALTMQLRKCCNHPYLLPNAAPEPNTTGEHTIEASGKFIVLEKLVNELVIKQGKKVLIFSGFTSMLDCCEDLLHLRGGDGTSYGFVRLDGTTGRARRNLAIRMFNDTESALKVMLISTRAGGLGINLATASDVILLDQDWNPQITLQAEARAHRIGQKNPVTIYKFCTQGTVEEQMMGRIQKKLYLSAKVTESMRDIHYKANTKASSRGKTSKPEEDMPTLSTGQLLSLVRRGAQALARPKVDVSEMLSWDWKTTVEKCKDKPVDVDNNEASEIDPEAEKKWLSQMEKVESCVFQGKLMAREKKEDRSNPIELSREARRVGKHMTVMVDGFAVSKESMNCADWEAVPTRSGKDPTLAEVKREKRAKVNNQDHCQACWGNGDVLSCLGCPRAYHIDCLDTTSRAKITARNHRFHCSQHRCTICKQNNQDAGGMIYRCRWCPNGYCEDCLDWDKTLLIGNNLKEYALLNYGANDQAFYIRCPSCTVQHEEDESIKKLCEAKEIEWDEKYAQALLKEEASTATATTLATIATTRTPSSSLSSLSDINEDDLAGKNSFASSAQALKPISKRKSRSLSEAENEGSARRRSKRIKL